MRLANKLFKKTESQQTRPTNLGFVTSSSLGEIDSAKEGLVAVTDLREETRQTVEEVSKVGFSLESLDQCFIFQKNQMLYAMSVGQMTNPSIHDFVILMKDSQINMDSFCLVKVTPKSTFNTL